MKILCLIGCHDWRNGPGRPCAICGEHDFLFCGCADCRERCGCYDDSDAEPVTHRDRVVAMAREAVMDANRLRMFPPARVPEPTILGDRTVPRAVSDLVLVLIIVAGLMVGMMAVAVRVEVDAADALRPKTVASRSHP